MAGQILVVRTYRARGEVANAWKVFDDPVEADKWMEEKWGFPHPCLLPDTFQVAELVDWKTYKRLYHLRGAAPHC